MEEVPHQHAAHYDASVISLGTAQLRHTIEAHGGEGTEDASMLVRRRLTSCVGQEDEHTARTMMNLAEAIVILADYFISILADPDARNAMITGIEQDQRASVDGVLSDEAATTWADMLITRTWQTVAHQRFMGKEFPPDVPAYAREFITKQVDAYIIGMMESEEASAE